MKSLILTDNPKTLSFAKELDRMYGNVDIYQSPDGPLPHVPELDLKSYPTAIIGQYKLILSIHCKQLFPAELLSSIRCVNVHPGYNPFNRGWFPHVFSIVNGLKTGVTIHEMDEQLDHGAIIAREEYILKSWDTSASAYANILKIERKLLLKHFISIRDGEYQTISPEAEGNINYRNDYEKLKFLNLDRRGTFKEFLSQLRALSHGELKNAYFHDENGKRVFVRVVLEPEEPLI